MFNKVGRLVVIDTNILVSALWSENNNPAKIINLVFNQKIKPCYDYRILLEYKEVLERPKFKFSKEQIYNMLSGIECLGIGVVPIPISIKFIDEDDKKFYEVAKFCNATLITGNLKHFPNDNIVMSALDFLRSVNNTEK